MAIKEPAERTNRENPPDFSWERGQRGIYSEGQCNTLCKIYVFKTGKKVFCVVHGYALNFNYENLDYEEIIPIDPLHKGETSPVYYGDEYFFFGELPI